MRPIQNATAFGPVIRSDVEKAIAGLSGDYFAADLYAQYRDLVTARGGRPGHIIAFGQTLADLGCTRRRRNNKSIWFI